MSRGAASFSSPLPTFCSQSVYRLLLPRSGEFTLPRLPILTRVAARNLELGKRRAPLTGIPHTYPHLICLLGRQSPPLSAGGAALQRPGTGVNTIESVWSE